jgi:hypothetical protein
MTKRLTKGFAALVATLGATLLAPAAWGQNATQCGVTGQAIASQTIVYDPFGALGLQQVLIPLSLTRATGGGGKKTQEVYFILTRPAGAPAVQLEATVPGGSTFSNIVYTNGSLPSGLPVISNNRPGQVEIQYGGAAQPDTVTINLRVTVPPNTDLSAGRPITFDILYVCKGTGGLADVLTPTVLPQAVSINVNVLSALQASYVGTPTLDFGEVGSVTNTQVLAAPATYTRTGNIRVASSGPYNITMTSANNYRLSFNGTTGAVVPTQSLAYAATFVQNTRTGVSGGPIAPQTAITRTCTRAGVGGLLLPLAVTLKEGGLGPAVKTPAPTYSDTLTITIAPKLEADVGIGSTCP